MILLCCVFLSTADCNPVTNKWYQPIQAPLADFFCFFYAFVALLLLQRVFCYRNNAICSWLQIFPWYLHLQIHLWLKGTEKMLGVYVSSLHGLLLVRHYPSIQPALFFSICFLQVIFWQIEFVMCCYLTDYPVFCLFILFLIINIVYWQNFPVTHCSVQWRDFKVKKIGTTRFAAVVFSRQFLLVQRKTETSCSHLDSIKKCCGLVMFQENFCHWLQLLRCLEK